MKKKYRNTCIVGTTYSLLFYLLLSEDDESKDTFFFIETKGIDPQIADKLHCCEKVYSNSSTKSFLFRIKSIFKWQFIKGTTIYSQDHLTIAPMLVGRNKYILIEDAPNMFSIWGKDTLFDPNRLIYPHILEKIPHFKGGMLDISNPNSILWKMYAYISHGRTYRKILGTNNQCVDRYYTGEEDINSPLIIGKKSTKFNLKELWDNSSKEKKRFILSVFGIDETVREKLLKMKTVAFTNPIMEDCGLSEREVLDIYKPIFDQFSEDGILIKPHPREKKFDYKAYFPYSFVFPSIIPSQLLSFIGFSCDTAITIYSTAISSLPADTNIIWIGTNVHTKIAAKWGNPSCPSKFHNVKVINHQSHLSICVSPMKRTV